MKVFPFLAFVFLCFGSDARALSDAISAGGVRFEQDGFWVEALSVPVETDGEMDLASHGIAAEISKNWLEGKTTLEAVVADTPTDGVYPKAEILRKVNPRKMMEQLNSHLKNIRITPKPSSILKLATSFGWLRQMHIPIGKGYWGYTLIRIQVPGLIAYRGIMAGHSPKAVLASAAFALQPLIQHAIEYKNNHRSIAGKSYQSLFLNAMAAETKRFLKSPNSLRFHQLMERKWLERTIEKIGDESPPAFFMEAIFGEMVKQLVAWLKRSEKRMFFPLTLKTMLSRSELDGFLPNWKAHEKGLEVLAWIPNAPQSRSFSVNLYTVERLGVRQTISVPKNAAETLKNKECDLRISGSTLQEAAPVEVPGGVRESDAGWKWF